MALQRLGACGGEIECRDLHNVVPMPITPPAVSEMQSHRAVNIAAALGSSAGSVASSAHGDAALHLPQH